eukprot:12185063-Karenia_brevis.AAC.1
MVAWMTTDSRYSNMYAEAAPRAVGTHLRDYEQEFIIWQLVIAGAEEFNGLTSVLIASISHIANTMPESDNR